MGSQHTHSTPHISANNALGPRGTLSRFFENLNPSSLQVFSTSVPPRFDLSVLLEDQLFMSYKPRRFRCPVPRSGEEKKTFRSVKTNLRFGECRTCFGYEIKTGVVRILVIFQRRPMFSHIIGKLSPRPFE